jgi:hypothetical protein
VPVSAAIRRSILLAGVAAALTTSVSASEVAAPVSRDAATCPSATPSPAYAREVMRALRAKDDVWGNELLATPGGPTYGGARRYLKPLLYAKAAGGAPLTSTGVYYVPFSGPVGVQGADSMALHVADGSEILSQRSSGRSLSVSVGPGGREMYGSCIARLATPRLAGGYLPILQTGYVDAQGVRYRQESFATRIPQTRSLVSFVALSVDTEDSKAGSDFRLTSSQTGLAQEGEALVKGGDTYLAFSPGGSVDESAVTYQVPAGTVRTVYVVYLNAPTAARPITPDRATYESARAAVARYWKRRVAEGMTIDVPERPVMDAQRSVLIQNLALAWRYSVGNPYQQFSFPEGVDVAEVMATRGFQHVARAILLESFTTPLTRYPNWKMGQKLVGSALYYRLSRDRSYVEQVTPLLHAYVAELGLQIRTNPRGILNRERFSSDIKDSVYGLHTQAVVWQGLRSMASVWAMTDHGPLAADARRLATRLGTGLRAAVRASQRDLSDGSLFVPARLFDAEKPYESVIESRAGGYWNLVAPYAFASGLFLPGSPQANRVLRYMLLHGSRLLGLVRAGAYSLYGLTPVYPTSGVNPVYGLNVARFLADNDRPDQLVLSLYGQLAAGMAPGTFVSGEGLSVAPLQGQTYRSMYLPPNAASNGSFLETLRLVLVHESRTRGGEPRGIELAYATPRAWLLPGKRIVVRRAPTSFGPVSFSMRSSDDGIHVTIDAPKRSSLATLSLRLRLPRGKHIGAVTLDGRPYNRVDVRRETIDLSGRMGRLELVVRSA